MNERVKALLILAIAALAVVAYALVPFDIDNGYVKLRKLNLGSLTSSVSWLNADSDTLSTRQTKPQKVISEPDTAHQTILFLGDSMTYGLSLWLDGYCSANGYRLYTIVWYSATTERYAKSDVIDTYIRRYHPTYFVVCLGSNELFVRDLPDRDKYVRTIIRKFGDKPYVWISPPNWKHDTGINSLIARNVGRQRFFDSSRIKLRRGKDHIHPTNSASKVWMDSIARWISNPRLTAHPIAMSEPRNLRHSPSYDIYQPDFTGFEGNDNPERHRHFKRIAN